MSDSRVSDAIDVMIEPHEEVPVVGEPNAGGVVAASNGWDAYMVWSFGTKRQPWECECASFRTRGVECKHIAAVKESVRSGRPTPGVISFFGGKGGRNA